MQPLTLAEKEISELKAKLADAVWQVTERGNEVDSLKEAAKKQLTSLNLLTASLQLDLLNQDVVISPDPLSNEHRIHLRILELLKAEATLHTAKPPSGKSAISLRPPRPISEKPQSTTKPSESGSPAIDLSPPLKRIRPSGKHDSTRIGLVPAPILPIPKIFPADKGHWDALMEFHGEDKSRAVMLIVFKRKGGGSIFSN